MQNEGILESCRNKVVTKGQKEEGDRMTRPPQAAFTTALWGEIIRKGGGRRNVH